MDQTPDSPCFPERCGQHSDYKLAFAVISHFTIEFIWFFLKEVPGAQAGGRRAPHMMGEQGQSTHPELHQTG